MSRAPLRRVRTRPRPRRVVSGRKRQRCGRILAPGWRADARGAPRRDGGASGACRHPGRARLRANNAGARVCSASCSAAGFIRALVGRRPGFGPGAPAGQHRDMVGLAAASPRRCASAVALRRGGSGPRMFPPRYRGSACVAPRLGWPSGVCSWGGPCRFGGAALRHGRARARARVPSRLGAAAMVSVAPSLYHRSARVASRRGWPKGVCSRKEIEGTLVEGTLGLGAFSGENPVFEIPLTWSGSVAPALFRRMCPQPSPRLALAALTCAPLAKRVADICFG